MSAIPEEATSLPTEEGVAPEQLGDPEPLPEFDHRYRDAFDGLMYLGALTKEFEWMGHRFVIRTLRSDELLAVGELIKPWTGTVAETRAYAIAVVALATETVDGKALPTPVEVEDTSYAWAFQRFNHVKARWYAYTIDAVYDRYLTLEGQMREVFEAMGKASGSATVSSESTPGSNDSSD